MVFLGVYAFDLLTEDEQSEVDAGVRDLLRSSFLTAASHTRWASWDLRAAYRGVAMANVGIAPRIQSLNWETLLPKRHWWQTRAQVPTAIYHSFNPMSPATAAAKTFLQSCGLEIPEGIPWERGNLDPVDGSGRFWRNTGLRASMEKKRGRGAI